MVMDPSASVVFCLCLVVKLKGKLVKLWDCLALDDGKWENGPELPVPVYLPRVTQIKGISYLLDSWEIQQLLELDPESNTWVRRASPPDGLDNAVSMTSLNDRLCVAGGCHDHVCLWYNPATDAWSKGQQPLMDHRWGSLVPYGNKVILLGGDTDEVEELCIETGAWSVSNMKLPRKLWLHQALVLDIPQQE